MFVADGKRALVLLPRGAPFPEGVVAGGRVLTRFNAREHVRVAALDDALLHVAGAETVCLVNPTYAQMLRVAVFLRRRAWAGDLLILLDSRSAPRAFQNINDHQLRAPDPAGLHLHHDHREQDGVLAIEA